jgi:hypothetical protein
MTPKQAAAMLNALGSEAHADDHDEWITAKCPLAPWTHKKGTDNNPSFAIHLPPGEAPYFNCFSCCGGSLDELVGTLEMYRQKGTTKGLHYDLKTAREILMNSEVDLIALPEYTEFSTHHTHQFEEWPQHYINSFMPWKYCKPAFEYLKSRGVTSDQAERFDLRYDTSKEMIVAPYANVYGKLAGARGRAVVGGKGHAGHFDYTWNNRNNAALVWYNEKVLNHGDTVVVVEGQFDVFAVDKVYPTVVGNLTAKPTPAKMKKLAQAPHVILMNDNDVAGQAANKRYVEYLEHAGTPWTIISYPEEFDYKGELVKMDPDKMGPDWIREQLKDLVDL